MASGLTNSLANQLLVMHELTWQHKQRMNSGILKIYLKITQCLAIEYLLLAMGIVFASIKGQYTFALGKFPLPLCSMIVKQSHQYRCGSALKTDNTEEPEVARQV